MTIAAPALICRQLRLRDFRNFTELELDFPESGVAVIGENGSGKSNLLEAIYYLEIFRSLRGAPDEQLIRFGADVFHVRGRFEDPASGETVEVTAAYEASTRTKRVTVDGTPPARLADAVGRVRIVVFSPTDMAIVAGPPAERRRFLDIVLSVNVPGHMAALQRYRHVLRQRNAMLKTGGSGGLLDAWGEGLIEAGAQIVRDRAAWIETNTAAFERLACRVGGEHGMRIGYRPGLPLDGVRSREDIASAFASELRRVETRERERGMTLAGPHRDDLAITTADGDREVDLRDFGSAGQMRTAAIALRLVEAETAKRVRQSAPLFLLDDVFAELDEGRSRRVLELLEEEGAGQIVLTVPKATDLDAAGGHGPVARLSRWRIRAGSIVS
ncbi:MAG: DNA replication and repair protein RecF [Gemmatimonadetes bacterium]|nr:DNA replication and repair protein RecF [Gemmatimonadota bacterium]